MHVCLFDIDGTLLASGGAGKLALERGLAEEYGRPEAIEHLRLSGRTDRAIVRDLLEAAGVGDSVDHRLRLLEAYLRHLPDCLALAPGQVLPGVNELIDRLKSRSDVVLGLLTGNIRRGASIKLGHFGLDSHFSFGGFGDDHLHREDVAREALAAVRSHLGWEPPGENIWVIGDTPLDVLCARAINARAVAVCTGWHPREELASCQPDYLLDDLLEPTFVEDMRAGA